MTRSVLVGVALAASLFASSNQSKVLFEQERYSQAYPLLYEAFLKSPANRENNYYLALTSMHLGKIDMAMSSFERVLMSNPTHKEALLYLAKLYFDSGDKVSSLHYLSQAQQLPLTKQERAFADQLNSILLSKEKRFHYKGMLQLSAIYDNNINNGNEYILKDVSELPIAPTTPVNPTTADSALSFISSNVVQYKMSDRYMFNTSLLLYAQKNRKEGKYNLLFGALSGDLVIESTSYQVMVGAFSEPLWFGAERYLIQNGLQSTIKFSDFYLGARYYQKEHSSDVNTVRDSRVSVFKIGGLVQKVELESSYLMERKSISTRSDVSLNQSALLVSYPIVTMGNVYFSVNGMYRRVEYLDATKTTMTKDEKKRSDNTLQAGGQMRYALNKRDGIILNLNTIQNRSTHPLFTYDKTSVTFGYQTQF